MGKIAKLQQPLIAAAIIGSLGLAAYGVIHTVSALADTGNPLPENQAMVNSTNQEQAKPDGAICNPYGCAGCSGCISLQYRQNIAETPGAVNSLEVDLYRE